MRTFLNYIYNKPLIASNRKKSLNIIVEGKYWSEDYIKNESILFEDKISMIKKLVLPDIEDGEEKEKYKSELISFFKKYSNFENKIDWNKWKTLTKSDFDNLIKSADQTKNAQKRREKAEIDIDLKNIFKSVGNKKFEIIGENDTWLFVTPLTYEAAKYCDSSENQGAGAKWCIGYEKTNNYWNHYINNGSIFVMAFNKNYKNMNKKELQSNLKYMIQKDQNKYIVWNQADKKGKDVLSIVGKEKSIADKMFDQAEKALRKQQEEENKELNKKIEKKIENLKNVKEIDEKYFTEEEKKKLTKIEIPNSVIRIGNRAFYKCNSLISVTIPNSITSIGDHAFAWCNGLASVTIPDSVTSIGDCAFYYCSRLTSVTIPDSVTSIGEDVFGWCSGLTSVTIPDSVTSIGDFAFTGCSGLKSVMIPNSVRSIGYHAFASCNRLTTVMISDGITDISKDTFKKCDNLKTIYCSKDIWNKFREEFPSDAERKDVSDASIYESTKINENLKNTITKASLIFLLSIPGILKAEDMKKLPEITPATISELANKDEKKFGGYSKAQAANILARTLYSEAADQSYDGKLAVASVIWNRANKDPQKLVEVCFKHLQFSCWNDIKPAKNPNYKPDKYQIKIPSNVAINQTKKQAWTDCKEIVSGFFNGTFESTIEDRNAYYNPDKSNPTWGKTMTKILKIDDHKFGYLADQDPTKNKAKKKNIYVVKAGDTLSAIAKKHNIDIDDLAKLNKIKNKNELKIGQKIKLS